MNFNINTILFSLVLTLGLITPLSAQKILKGKHILKVMTYNIHHTKGMDNKKDLERIAQIIKREKPDIVGLQEVSNLKMANELGRLSSMNVVFASAFNKDTKYGDAILCKHPFKALNNELIPSASPSRYQAMAIDVDLSKVYGQDLTLRFVNTHFDWLKTLGSQYARLASVEVIEKAYFEKANIPGILTGDLNATPDSAPLKKLFELGWSQNIFGKNIHTLSNLKPNSDKIKRQIDYVLVRNLNQWKIISTKVLSEHLASDHLPLLIELEFLNSTQSSSTTP